MNTAPYCGAAFGISESKGVLLERKGKAEGKRQNQIKVVTDLLVTAFVHINRTFKNHNL